MATATQIAKKMQEAQIALLNEQLAELDKHLRKYEPLIEQKKRLEAARRALLSERAPTAGGGRGLTMEEVDNALREMQPATVHEVAAKLSATDGAVRAHFNRGKGEHYEQVKEDGVVKWSLREPENDDPDEDEDDDE